MVYFVIFILYKIFDLFSYIKNDFLYLFICIDFEILYIFINNYFESCYVS